VTPEWSAWFDATEVDKICVGHLADLGPLWSDVRLAMLDLLDSMHVALPPSAVMTTTDQGAFAIAALWSTDAFAAEIDVERDAKGHGVLSWFWRNHATGMFGGNDGEPCSWWLASRGAQEINAAWAAAHGAAGEVPL